jgi:hypothetical protein
MSTFYLPQIRETPRLVRDELVCAEKGFWWFAGLFASETACHQKASWWQIQRQAEKLKLI